MPNGQMALYLETKSILPGLIGARR